MAFKEILLTKGFVTVVDGNDYDWLMQWNWQLHTQGYAFNSNGLMHRLIMKAEVGQLVDHINGNKLDNRRSNLRLCTKSQNNLNSRKIANTTSRFKGVTWVRKRNKWQAQLQKDKRHLFLGYFQSEEDAARAYNEAVASWQPTFAKSNLVENHK